MTPFTYFYFNTGFGGPFQVGMSGDLPSTTAEPTWWDDQPDDNEPVGRRGVKTDWERITSGKLGRTRGYIENIFVYPAFK